LTEAEHRFSLSGERISTAAERAEMAAEYLRLTERGFGLGESDLISLLRARSRSVAAEQTHREALILYQSSAAEMNQALGVVP
jgi:cobalt-zinc-cadmium efflux system outer membrane protein